MLPTLCTFLVALAAAAGADSTPAPAELGAASASDSSLSRPAVVLPPYIVTAKRIPSPTLDVAQSVAIVSARTIEERQASGIAEALEDETSILVQETGNGMDSVFLRGLTGKQTLMLVDGVRLNNSAFRSGPNQYLNTVDEGLAERIELVRGPGSVLYGSDALGGVINVLTMPPPGRDAPPVGGTAKFRVGGADGEMSSRVRGHGRAGAWGWNAGVAFKDFSNIEGGAATGEQQNTGYSENAFDARLDHRTASRVTTSVRFQQNSLQNLQRTDRFRFNRESYVFDPQRRTAVELRTALDPVEPSEAGGEQRGWLRSGAVAVNYQLQEEGIRRQGFGSTTVRKYRDDIGTVGVMAQASGSFHPSTRQVVGAEAYFDAVDSKAERQTIDGASGTVLSTGFEQSTYPDDASYRSLGVFAQNEWTLGRGFDLTTGARAGSFHAGGTVSVAGNDVALDANSDAFTGSAALGFRPTPGTRVYVGVARGFRAPNLDDLAALRATGQGIDVPSPDLGPETLVDYEVGFKHSLGRMAGEVYLFYSDFDDLIARVPVSYNGAAYEDLDDDSVQDPGEAYLGKQNLGSAYIKGVEVTQRWRLFDQSWLDAGGSYLWGRNNDDGTPLSRIPPAQGRLGWRQGFPAVRSWAQLDWVSVRKQDRLSTSDRGDPRFSPRGTPGYMLLHLRAGSRIGDRVRAHYGVENFLDHDYRVHGSGVEGIGRNFYLALELALR